MTKKRPKVMAIASAGGHWVQLLRLRPVWDDCDVVYVTTEPSFRSDVEEDARSRGQAAPAFFTVCEANRWQKLKLIRQIAQIAFRLLLSRPDVVISTGAAPGFFAVRLGRLLGARTVWLDSIANADELSLSCRKVGPHADLWLTQWPHLAGEEGTSGRPKYRGAVL